MNQKINFSPTEPEKMYPEIDDCSALNKEIAKAEKLKKIKNDVKDALEIIKELKGLSFLEKESPFWPLVLLQIFQEIRSSDNIFPIMGTPITDNGTLPNLEEKLLHMQEGLKFLSLKEYLKNREKDHIQKALDLNDWNPEKAADALGISRTTFWRKVKKHSIGREALRR